MSHAIELLVFTHISVQWSVADLRWGAHYGELYFYLGKGGMSNHLNQWHKTIFRSVKPMYSYPPSSMESENSDLGGIKSTQSSG